MQNWLSNSFQKEFEQGAELGRPGENMTSKNCDWNGANWYNETFTVRDITGETYAIYLDINHGILKKDPYKIIITSSIENYLRAKIGISTETYMYVDELICCGGQNERKQQDRTELIKQEQLQLISNRNPDHYRELWEQCEKCFIPNYKKMLKSNMQICEECGSYFKMTSSDRIDLLIDEGTWNPLDQDMVSLDSIEFDSEAELECYEDFLHEWNKQIYRNFMRKLLGMTAKFIEKPKLPQYIQPNEKGKIDQNWTKPNLNEEWVWDLDDDAEAKKEEEKGGTYIERLAFYKKQTGLLDAVQTGVGQLNGIPVAFGVMDFQFLAGSMGCVVGEKITRLIEHATKNLLPLLIMSASGGARVHEGSLSLMQMAKISSALYNYQSNTKLFYVSILTSPTTGGVTASFAMLGDILITEPGTFVAFAGPRVVQQILNETIPEEEQEAESLFEKGFFDLIVPRQYLKGVISELFKLHAFQ
uniref:acetyl-CoA carboxylase carboxyltransferase beta subunit n=1 Tax=Cuscuta vandevenderi TaxID=1458423 RepID=UPI002435A253|nr:acetyl-CoA carboxylase carboxyltransferase beta subunit [Cuscuta vandevenderi]WEY30060.1 acetyl-CoA carboxylase carboxyltransferase beta subunit [Cuscuta vandevenderi]